MLNGGPHSQALFSFLTSFFVFRARELAAEQNIGARYRPPALRGMASGGSPPNESTLSLTTPGDAPPPPPSNYPPGFRRARAGTLPSNVQLAAQQRFGTSSSTIAAPDSILDSPQGRSGTTSISTNIAPGPRPGLRHSSTVASSATGVVNRNRSESLTLPSGGMSNPFGGSIFSSWLSSSNANGGNFPVLEELRSVTSADSQDDFDVHTLDYLGLDDGHRPPPAATLSELRNQAQAAIAGNLAGHPSRMRASTVSNPYRTRPPIATSLLPTPASEEEEYAYEEPTSYQNLTYDNNIDTNYGGSGYMAKGFKQNEHLQNRPRAISVGTLEDPMRSLQRRASAIDAHSYVNELTHQSSGLSVVSSNISTALKTDKPAVGRNVHFPNGEVTSSRASAYLLAPGATNRSVSPKSEGPSSQIQTPTRSLWIGNLDSAVTSEQLIRVFAPYGAIESLRLLPEKVRCTHTRGQNCSS